MKTKSPALKNRPIGMKPSWAVFNIKLELAREIIYNYEDKSLETKFQKHKKKRKNWTKKQTSVGYSQAYGKSKNVKRKKREQIFRNIRKI